MISERRSKGPVLVLDAGDALFQLPSKADERARAQARLVLAGMAEVGTAAMAVGDRDLAAGLDWLRAEAKEAGIPLLSANLERPGGEKPFEPSALLAVGEKQVGVIGLWAKGTLPAGLVAASAAAAAKAEAAKLRARGAQLVVALVHGSTAEAMPLAAVEGIDLVVPAHDGHSRQPVAAPGGGWVLGAGSRGRQVLVVEVHPDGAGALADAGSADRLAREVEYVERRLAEARKRRDGERPELRKTYEKMVESFEARLATLRTQVAGAGMPEGRRFRASEISLDEHVADQPALQARVDAFEKAHGKAEEMPHLLPR